MSRFYSDYDDYGTEGILAAGRFEENLHRAIKGKRGQRALRDLEQALLAMPERRLVDSELATPAGEVCVVGCAVAAARVRRLGLSWDSAVQSLVAEDPTWEGYEQAAEDDRRYGILKGDWVKRDPNGWIGIRRDDYDGTEDDRTANAGREAGFVWTLAWQLGWLNDEEFGNQTPEQRWESMLRWTRNHLDKSEVVVSS